MGPEEVTLAVPCYNVADTLPRVLDAIEELDPAPRSVLCVDDGSTDETTEIIEGHEEVQLIEHGRNKGLGATLNTALAHTETRLFAKLDGDIVVPPDWLATVCREMNESGAHFVQGRFIDETATLADEWRARYVTLDFSDRPVRNVAFNGANHIGETDALRDIGGWDSRYRRAFDDIDVMNRLMEAGYDVYYAPAVEATHIRTDTWREVLRTDWAYFNIPVRGGQPDTVIDVVRRIPVHLVRSGVRVALEARKGRFDLATISFLLPFTHLKWDLDRVLTDRVQRDGHDDR